MSLPLSIHPHRPVQMPLSVGFSKYSIYMDGVNDEIQVADDLSLRITKDLVMEIWVYPIEFTVAAWNVLLTKRAGGGRGFQLSAWGVNADDGRLQVGIETTAGWNPFWMGGHIYSGNLYHVLVTYNRTTGDITIWVNGEDTTNSIAANDIVPGNDPVSIDSLNNWEGRVNNARIYADVFDLHDVLYNMLNYHSPIMENCRMCLQMEEGSDLTAYDSSPEGNDGSLLPVVDPPIWRRDSMWELRSEVGL